MKEKAMKKTNSKIPRKEIKKDSGKKRKNIKRKNINDSQLLQVLLENIPDHVYFKDRQSRFIRTSRAHKRILGLEGQEEVVGKTDFDFFPREYAQKFYDEEQKIMESGNPVIAEEWKLPQREGGAMWVSRTKIPLMNTNHKVTGLVGISRNITVRKHAEEALLKAQQEISQKAKDLEQTNKALERSNEELEQFAYVASHDLQEPLRMVSSYMALLEKRNKEKLDAESKEFIGFAVDGAKRMQQLINDLLSYSRVTTQGKPFVQTDVEEVFGRVLQNLKVTIEESGANVTHDPLPTVMADGVQLERLLQNLVGNAIKYRDKSVSPEVHVSAVSQNDEWIFSIRDNGIGIDPKYHDRIFGIFQRLQTREQYSGTGIGLAVCKKIVERHNGRIRVESEEGKGSTFFFSLPHENLIRIP